MALREGKGRFSLIKRLEAFIAPCIEDLGYELLDLEFQAARNSNSARIRLFIDFPKAKEQRIGIDDCVLVDKALGRVLESEAFEAIFPHSFTLEVSSPGIDKPLKKKEHFEDNMGKHITVKTYRPLTEEEIGNMDYCKKNPKQKKFLGKLCNFSEGMVFMQIDSQEIRIPFSLISKANLSISEDIMNSANLEK